MEFEYPLIGTVLLTVAAALIVSFLMTPPVKSLAYKVGAIEDRKSVV